MKLWKLVKLPDATGLILRVMGIVANITKDSECMATYPTTRHQKALLSNTPLSIDATLPSKPVVTTKNAFHIKTTGAGASRCAIDGLDQMVL